MFLIHAAFFIFLLPSNFVLSAKAKALKGEEVIGGLPTKSGEIKYVVSIQHSTVPRQPFYPICTGGIIGKRYILSAAHCFYTGKTDTFRYGQFKIVAGKIDLNTNDTSSVEILVKKIYIPKNYNNLCWNNRTGSPKADIAVLKLKTPLDLDHNDKLEKLFLPKVNSSNPDDNTPYVNTYATVAGYGWDKIGFAYWKNGSRMVFGTSSKQLLKAQTVIIDQTKCLLFYHRKVIKSNMCARVINHTNKTVQGICSGDSGSPLVSDNNIVIGVAIAAIEECNENKTPGLYTRVTSYVQFIRNAKKNVTDNMRVYTAHEDYTVFFRRN